MYAVSLRKNTTPWVKKSRIATCEGAVTERRAARIMEGVCGNAHYICQTLDPNLLDRNEESGRKGRDRFGCRGGNRDVTRHHLPRVTHDSRGLKHILGTKSKAFIHHPLSKNTCVRQVALDKKRACRIRCCFTSTLK